MTTVSLPALSLWQPYASLIFTGHKVHETRSWRLPEQYRNTPVLIHATASAPPVAGELLELSKQAFGVEEDGSFDIPRGALIGFVNFASCVSTDNGRAWESFADRACGDFEPKRFAWRITKHMKFERPLPMRGRQQFWQAAVPKAYADLRFALAA